MIQNDRGLSLVPNAQSAPPGSTSAPAKHEDLDDDSLMLLAAGGDQRAFGALVRRHEQAVRRFLSRIVGTADAPDLAQESFVKLWHMRARYRAEGRFTVFLYRTAKNAAFSSLRWRRVRQAISLGMSPTRAHTSDNEREAAALEPDALARALAHERRAELNAVLANLKVELRVVLVLRYAEGLDYATIASVVGISEENARARAHRGTAWLKAELARRASGPPEPAGSRGAS